MKDIAIENIEKNEKVFTDLSDRIWEYAELSLKEFKSAEDYCATLEALGFEVIPSMANFVFAKSEKIGGEALYLGLKERGILVRHFKNPRIKDYNRITIGTREQMEALMDAVNEILKEV